MIKSEVETEEREDECTITLACFCCDFETPNIDELDEHILVNHGEENSDEKFEIVADEPAKPKPKAKKTRSPTSRSRGKFVYSNRDTKFEICQDTEQFSIGDDADSPRPKRAKRTPAEEMNCHLCSFVTRKKSVLATHMLNHSDVIPPVYYKCSLCPYQTKRKNDMPKHMLGHCSNDSVPLYKCKYCPYLTKRKGDLPKHEMNHAERDKIVSWNCSECEYSSKRKNDLHKHMLTHSDRHVSGVFKCLKCSYATNKVIKFSRHVLSKCKLWDEPVNLEHLLLEDILASVDENGVHVVLESDSEGENQVQIENEYGEGVEYVEYIEGIEEEETEAVVVEGEIVEGEYIQEEGESEMVEIQSEEPGEPLKTEAKD
ncbi:unnamed protein product [Phyllotreta striolata]|uniref:C2H2-type domain-containing protein n=1 Tax=Phyllotreta striolata TaxID=444603 RepID=A0A9N9TYJ0_PHYSR|nr:unnamed protein product [Phyllotreta striolata]